MRTVEENGLIFEELISPAQIAEAVNGVAERINRDYSGKEPLFIVVLNGAFIFAADLFRRIKLHSQVTFVRLKSYTGTCSSGEIREVVGLTEDIRDQDIIVVEDIVDTGFSMRHFLQTLKDAGARSAEVCTMLFKPDSLQCPEAKPKYVGMEIPKRFILGYGLDLDDYGRNHDAIYALRQKDGEEQ